MKVFNSPGSMVECSGNVDESPFSGCQCVVQIPAPVQTEVNRSSAQKMRGKAAVYRFKIVLQDSDPAI